MPPKKQYDSNPEHYKRYYREWYSKNLARGGSPRVVRPMIYAIVNSALAELRKPVEWSRKRASNYRASYTPRANKPWPLLTLPRRSYVARDMDFNDIQREQQYIGHSAAVANESRMRARGKGHSSVFVEAGHSFDI
jgi:hypothetical protein